MLCMKWPTKLVVLTSNWSIHNTSTSPLRRGSACNDHKTRSHVSARRSLWDSFIASPACKQVLRRFAILRSIVVWILGPAALTKWRRSCMSSIDLEKLSDSMSDIAAINGSIWEGVCTVSTVQQSAAVKRDLHDSSTCCAAFCRWCHKDKAFGLTDFLLR